MSLLKSSLGLLDISSRFYWTDEFLLKPMLDWTGLLSNNREDSAEGFGFGTYSKKLCYCCFSWE